MADLRASTSLTSCQRGQGSPFAAELDRRLAGDEPLINAITWWVTEYFAWRKTQPDPGEGGPSLMDLTDNETSALTLDIGWSFPLTGEDEELTKYIMAPDVYPDVQSAWDDMRQARTTLRAAAAAAGAQPQQQA